MVFHCRLSDSKSPQVSMTLLSILSVFNNAVVSMVSARPSTSKSSRLINKLLVTVPKAQITTCIIVTFIFYSFFQFSSTFFQFYSVLSRDSKVDNSANFLFCCCLFLCYIGLAVRVFANGPGDLGSIPARVIPQTQKNGTWCRLA